MKLTRMIAAAGLVVASLGVSVAADAQPARVVTTRTVHTKVVDNHRAGWNHKRHCRTEWHHHHRVQRCG